MLDVCQVLAIASEQLGAPQIELIPIEKFSLWCDSILAPVYICMTDVHQRIAPNSWGIALNIWYRSALTTGFPLSEKQLDRPRYKESKAGS